jgi:hypothetical protein
MRRYDTSTKAVVVALDPGGTTGWSVMCVEPDALAYDDVSVLRSITHWTHGQVGGDEREQAHACAELVAAWEGCALVIEKFTLRKFIRHEELLSPVRIGSMVEYAVWSGRLDVDRDTRIWKQEPSMAKSTATDERLKDWGLYEREGGMGHARDADRHAITFLRRAAASKQIRHQSWPYLYDKHGRLIEDEENVS